MKKLSNLKPERVFHYFEEICSIPHGSGNTSKISDYCVEFAKKNNLEYIREEIGNVIIKKLASLGKENSPVIVLQGHIDMVCEKNPDSTIDFERDGIDVYFEDGFVKANGTTLGGDNGIAVAMCMALLEDTTIKHPPLEVLFTVDEETGMYGAKALCSENIKGRKLINIDSEEEGIFTVSCAGGIRAVVNIPVSMQNNFKKCYKVVVTGLLGGHSGVDIDKGRLNANKVCAQLLGEIKDFNLISINGGLKDNAITSHCEAVIASECDISTVISDFLKTIDKQNDNRLEILVEATKCYDRSMDSISTKNVLNFLIDVPNGIIGWSKDIKGLVETSLNLGILTTDSEKVTASFALRSSVNGEKIKLLEQVRQCAQQNNGEFESEGDYPAWEYNKKSTLRDKMVSVFEEMYGKAPEIIAIHAGLECGLLSEKLDGLDAVSIGPNMFDIHTPRERLNVESTNRVYSFLLELLKKL
ncbi:MAG: aminoacyl-histidine dipeptidase [Acutalibacteraceae bacterium]|nr:aminoacyl-histidine dipeptidase [Acutalibacteraceae bacterium]